MDPNAPIQPTTPPPAFTAGPPQQEQPHQPQQSSQPHSGVRPLAVVGLVPAFIVPPVGLIIGIVVLAKKLLGANEVLGILSLVFGLINTIALALLILLSVVTYMGIQERGRDAGTKVNALAMRGQVEAYWATTGSYPSTGQLKDKTWLKANLDTSDDKFLDSYLTDSRITYQTTPEDCQNTAESPCEEYLFTLALSTGQEQVKPEYTGPSYDIEFEGDGSE